MATFANLIKDIQSCRLCADVLPLGPRPVLQADPKASILIVGQAPGTAVHASGQPFDDPSGDRLRDWMGVSPETFYDPQQIALVPMGFCYPGKGKGGDLPPRPECAEQWRAKLLGHLTNIEVTIILGRYAIDWHLPEARGQSLQAVVSQWRTHPPGRYVLPHPSPRNNLWLRRNAYVEGEIIPHMQAKIRSVLADRVNR